MAIVNTFNVGHDVAVDLIDPVTGAVINWPPPTEFTSKSGSKVLASSPIDQPPIHRVVEEGWSGTLGFDRADNSIDAFFSRNETLYWQGVDIPGGSITETIKEADGSISQYQFTTVQCQYAGSGTWKAQDKVSLQVAWVASQRKTIV